MLLIFLLLNLHVLKGQVDCSIDAGADKAICSPGNITLSVTGNPNEVQWKDETGTIVGRGASINVEIENSTRYTVINKVTIGPELIANGNFEAGNTGFTSDYFESCVSGTMPQGAFCINDNSGDYHAGWSDCKDRSGSGLMLISDGATAPNEAIWCQTVNIEQNKDYAFSAWINTVINLAPPVMQFRINGNVLGQPFESNDTPCEWQEFYEIWNSGTATTAEICILNQNTIGNGNDFGIDDISLREACYSEDEVLITIIDSIKVDLGPDTTFCKGDDYQLMNYATNSVPNLLYDWSTGESSSTIVTTQPDTYTLRVYTADGCEGKDTVLYENIGTPTIILPTDTHLCFIAYPNTTLYAGEALETLWKIEDKEDTSSDFIVDREGYYTVILSNGKSCSARQEIYVESKCSHNLFLPNAFTPNHDGVNDTFGPKTLETYAYRLIIYDRWGNVVFESTNSKDQWDGKIGGKMAQGGVYVYYLIYKLVDYYEPFMKDFSKSGTVTLIR